MKIIAIMPELGKPGGVQRVSRQICDAISRYSHENKHKFKIYSLNDPADTGSFEVSDQTVRYTGFERNKFALWKKALSEAASTDFAFIGHPYLSLIGLSMKMRKPSLRYGVHTYGIEVWEPMLFHRQVGMRFAHVITNTSDYTAEEMVHQQGMLNSPKLVTLYPALDPKFTHENEDNRIHEAKGHYFLTVARLSVTERRKHFEEAIKAFGLFSKDNPEWEYKIVGDGDYVPKLKEIARDAGVEDKVIFTGRVSDEEMRTLYQGCRAFVLPSGKEGFGIVFVEAMIYGKIGIGGNQGGTPEIFRDGEEGFLVKPGSVEEIYHAMCKCKDEEKLQEMGHRAIKRVHDHFLYERLVKTVYETLDEALKT